MAWDIFSFHFDLGIDRLEACRAESHRWHGSPWDNVAQSEVLTLSQREIPSLFVFTYLKRKIEAMLEGFSQNENSYVTKLKPLKDPLYLKKL